MGTNYTINDIRVGSYVVAPGKSRETIYKVIQLGTRLGGDNSFLGQDIGDDPGTIIQIVSCGSIRKILNY